MALSYFLIVFIIFMSSTRKNMSPEERAMLIQFATNCAIDAADKEWQKVSPYER
jgi:hypothetical protein